MKIDGKVYLAVIQLFVTAWLAYESYRMIWFPIPEWNLIIQNLIIAIVLGSSSIYVLSIPEQKTIVKYESPFAESTKEFEEKLKEYT